MTELTSPSAPEFHDPTHWEDKYEAEENRPYMEQNHEPWEGGYHFTYDDPSRVTSPGNVRMKREDDQGIKWEFDETRPYVGMEFEPGWYRDPKNVNEYTKTKFQHMMLNSSIIEKSYLKDDILLKIAEAVVSDPKLGSIITSEIHENIANFTTKLVKSGVITETEKIEISKSVGEVLEFLRELIPPDLYNTHVDVKELENTDKLTQEEG